MPTIRPLGIDDASACVADGVATCAKAVRGSFGRVAEVDGAVVGFLTVDETALVDTVTAELRAEGRSLLLVRALAESVAEPGVVDGNARTRAVHRAVGFIGALELTELWPNQTALLMVKHL